MMRTAKRWATGCSCGCGLLLLLLGLLGWGGYVYIMGIVGQVEQAEQAMAEVRERHGAVADFQPSPTGEVPAERIEAFLRVRDLMADARQETEGSLSLLSSDGLDDTEQVPGVLGELLQWGLGAARVGGAKNLLPHAVGFLSARGEALLEAGMGPGEYFYLYSITYYSWLRKSPADGPAFRFLSDDESESGGGRAGQDEFDVREGRRDEVLTFLNEALLPMLRRQLAALEEIESVDARWRERLASEVEAMESDRFRIPWRDGLPEPIEASLEPYRRPLESSYSALCNSLEIISGSEE